jgi:uncharacterized protein
MPTPTSPSPTPWYRERWPWLLIAGPAVVVVAGAFTAWLAVSSDDGLVAADYYKRGLLINKELALANRAAELGIAARVSVTAEGAIDVELTRGAEPDSEAPALELELARPTKDGASVAAKLVAQGGGRYSGRVAPLTAGRWLVTLRAGDWQLGSATGESLPGQVRLAGRP